MTKEKFRKAKKKVSEIVEILQPIQNEWLKKLMELTAKDFEVDNNAWHDFSKGTAARNYNNKLAKCMNLLNEINHHLEDLIQS